MTFEYDPKPSYLYPNPHGFDFSLCKRNEALSSQASLPKATKTGTTIVGILFKVCIVKKRV